MIVYHGSFCDIHEIDLSLGSRYKDFGKGFYVTPNKATAERMAVKKAMLFGGTPTVISYEFNESILHSSELKVLEFPVKATPDWLLFIDHNRNRHSLCQPHDYDIVKGPIADDGVALQLDKLRAHADTAESIAAALQDKYLDQQIYFGTIRSLQYLKKLSVCTIK